MALERRAIVRTRRLALSVAIGVLLLLGLVPAVIITPIALVVGAWGWWLAGAFLVFPLVLFLLGFRWQWRWDREERAARADERGLWLDGKLAWRREDVRIARLDAEGLVVLQGRRRLATVDVRPDGAAWLAAMHLDPDRSVGRFRMHHGSRRATQMRGLAHVAGFTMSTGVAAYGSWPASLVLLFLTFAATFERLARRAVAVEVGADGVRFVRRLSGARQVPFGAIARVSSADGDVRFELAGGETVVVHQPSRTRSRAMLDAPDHEGALLERVTTLLARDRSAGEPYARGGRSTTAWLEELAHVGDGTFRVAAVPDDVLWRVVEDPTAAATARAGAAFALRSSLDDDGRMRLRVLADACVSPRLRVAFDGIANDGDPSAALDALVDETPARPERART